MASSGFKFHPRFEWGSGGVDNPLPQIPRGDSPIHVIITPPERSASPFCYGFFNAEGSESISFFSDFQNVLLVDNSLTE